MPLVGLLNDPNGLVQFKGIYHVFYQWNPFETEHGIKFWGHYSTTNFINWIIEPIALSPSDWYDKNGCYSGSAVECNDHLYLFYTGNVKGDKNERFSYQCAAVSKDGVIFQKKGPVIFLPEGYTSHFRDPKVWKVHDSWYMIIGAQNSNIEGQAVLYISKDLMNWRFIGPVAGSYLNGLGDLGYMWECPDMFELDGRDVLLVSPQGIKADGIRYNNEFQSGYFVGKMNFENHKYSHGEFIELDRGFDFYAPQTMLDQKGRRILIAWMGMSDHMQDFQPTKKYMWVHMLTIPRELRVINDVLYQIPLEELVQLRSNVIIDSEARINQVEHGLCIEDHKTLEISLKFDEVLKDEFQISVRNNVKIIYNPKKKVFTLERRNFKSNKIEQRHCVIDNLKNLQIFIDLSSIEIFINYGQEVFSSRFFAEENESKIVFSSKSEVKIHVLAWELNEIIIEDKSQQNIL
jgi:beta-fructofuranosidase